MNTPWCTATWVVLVVASSLAVPAAYAGPGIVDEHVEGNVLEARIQILGIHLAHLRIEFEDVTGLEPGALGLSARRLNLFEILLVLLRLPDSILNSIPLELPLLLTIDPSPGLEMRGTAYLSLRTDLLPYVLGTPLRLFASPIGGAFEDVTAVTDSGSYRVGARRPVFTQQYVVATDLRSHDRVAARKLDILDAILAQREGVIDPAVFDDLATRSGALRTAFEGGDAAAAIAGLDGFVAAVQAESGDGIPDTWRPGGDLINAAGELRSQAATLRYSLVRLPGSL